MPRHNSSKRAIFRQASVGHAYQWGGDQGPEWNRDAAVGRVGRQHQMEPVHRIGSRTKAQPGNLRSDSVTARRRYANGGNSEVSVTASRRVLFTARQRATRRRHDDPEAGGAQLFSRLRVQQMEELAAESQALVDRAMAMVMVKANALTTGAARSGYARPTAARATASPARRPRPATSTMRRRAPDTG